MPALRLPLRFLLVAPWFGVAAGMVTVWCGAEVFASRWNGAALAVVHLLTIGCLAMAMAGSLVQMVPVVAGLPLRGPVKVLQTWCVPLLGGGALALAAAFLGQLPALFATAGIVLAAAFGLLIAGLTASLCPRRANSRAGAATAEAGATGVRSTVIAVSASVESTQAGGTMEPARAVTAALVERTVDAAGAATPAGAADILRGMRVAVVGLGGAVGCGLALAAWLAGGPTVPAVALADVHAALGLVGWVTTLVIAVSLQVVPMFQGTALYPQRAARWLAPLLAATLVIWAAARWAAMYAADERWAAAHLFDSPDAWRTLLDTTRMAGMTAVCAYASLTVWLLLHRRRRTKNASTTYWHVSLASLMAAAVMFAWPGEVTAARTVAIGTLFLLGFAMAAVNGMLYKIVPFLLWYHLQEQASPGMRPPKMTELIGEAAQRRQLAAYAAAVTCATAACWIPELARPAGALLAIACTLLALDLARPVLRHRHLLTTQPS